MNPEHGASILRSITLGVTTLAIAGGFSLIAAQSIAADQQKSAARTFDKAGSKASPQVVDEASVAHVLNRVAFGPRPGDVERVKRIGIDAYIDEQLYPERIAMPAALAQRLAALNVQRVPAGTLIETFREEQRAVREAQRNQATGAAAKEDAVAERREQYRRFALESADARLAQAIDSPRQLQEVMTDFWYNHFNVFVGKGLDRVLVSNYERDAIRPHAMGRFRELLGATAKHPAMLFYLDNWLSTGANAEVNRAGKKQAGLNENYARELMELHTLGVENEGKSGGRVENGVENRVENYTQKDVTELARMLTGWTFDGRAAGQAGPVAGVESQALFVFAPRRHDNGSKVWLGHQIEPSGQQEGEYALDVLAMHPATAKHISFQLAQYFVADQPPDALVARMTARYLATDGDIREVLRTLFYSPEFRDPRTINAKFKTPYQYVISAARASGYAIQNVQPLVGTLAQLGMPLYGCQTPDGYKNTEAAWLNPEGIPSHQLRDGACERSSAGRSRTAVARACRDDAQGAGAGWRAVAGAVDGAIRRT